MLINLVIVFHWRLQGTEIHDSLQFMNGQEAKAKRFNTNDLMMKLYILLDFRSSNLLSKGEIVTSELYISDIRIALSGYFFQFFMISLYLKEYACYLCDDLIHREYEEFSH